jgi:hypothetical protein
VRKICNLENRQKGNQSIGHLNCTLMRDISSLSSKILPITIKTVSETKIAKQNFGISLDR